MPRQKKVKLIGLGVPANLLKEFIDYSYLGNTSISPSGYEIDTPLSDSRVKVYKKIGSNEVIIVHRGSVGKTDWLDNLSYIVRGKVKGTKSYELHKERQLKAVEKYGKDNNLIGLAHSRGGLYLQELQKDPATKLNEIITYNKAVGFYDALRTNPAEQTDVKVKNDFVSLLSGLQKRPKKMVEIEATKNPLDLNKAHQPAELEKLGETFIGLKEDEKPMEGSGRAPSPKTLDQLKKILKTLEGKLEKINKGKVYKTTNKDKVSYDISYTKARIKNHETNGEDLIITKKAKYGNELPKKAKPYKAKPKKEPKKEEPKKEEPKKEEPKKEEPKKKEPKKKEDIKKEDFKDMWDYYSALWYIPNPNRPNKGARYNFYNDFNDNIIKLGSIENPRKTTHKGFEEITNKEALSILIELRERMENYLKTGDYGKYYTLAEVKKLLEMIEKPIEEHTKYLNKKKEPKKEEPKKEEPKKEEPKPAPTPKKEEPKPVLELPTPDPTPKKIEPLINKLENKIEEFEKVGREHGAVIYQAGTFIQVVAYIALLMEYEAKCAILGDKGEHKIKINSKLRSPMNKEFYENAEKLSGDLLDCIEREDKLIAIPLSLAFGSSPDGHANLLIYRPFEKTIERFEPHGSRYGGKNGKEADEVFNSVLKKMFEVEMKPYLKEYTPKFISPDQICPNPKGFQALEAEVANLKQEGGGFCGMWSLFILELLFINPTKPTAEIIKEALAISKEDPQYLRNVIRGYVKKTERLLDDYVKKIDANEGFTFAKGKDLKGKQVAFQEKLLELLLSFGGKNSQVKELQTEITTKKEQKNKYKDLIALIETKSINEINNMMQKVYDSHGFRGKNWTMTSIINNIIKKQEDLEGAPDNLQYKKQKMIFDFFNEPMPKKEEPKPEPKKEEPKKEEPKRGEAPFKGASKKHRNFELEFIFKEVKENLERINAFKEKMKTKGFLKYIPENRNGYMTQVLNIIDVLGEFDISLGKGDDWQKTQQINRLKKDFRGRFNSFIERNYPSEKRMSLSFIPLYDNELAELKTYLKKHDLKLPNLTDLFSEVKKYDDDANAEEKAKIEGGIFGFSAEEKEARKKRNAEKRAEIDAQKKKRAEKLKELREALNAIKKKKQEKKEAETKAEEIVEAPKAEEDAEQEVTITEPNIEGSGYKKSYVEEIAKPTNPMFAFKSALGVPMFIDPENEYLMIDEMYGGAAQDMLGMNCYDGKCFNPVWEKEKIKRQILSEYKIWYWPWGTPPAGHIRMPWLNAMVEERYKPLYDEFVARRNVNIGLDANASKDDFGRQMFSNLTDALSYVPVLNLPTTIGLSVASAVSDIKKEPVEPIDTD